MLMLNGVGKLLSRLANEPPFRLGVQQLLKLTSTTVHTKVRWSLGSYTQYLTGIDYAARQARREIADSVSVIEFGVAGGRGLLAMQRYAQEVERESGITINVIGFDAGSGLPESCGDFRDHPDHWKAGDYVMDEQLLRNRLKDRSRLIIGPLKDTVPAFLEDSAVSPIGFIAFDLDYYSSTCDALSLLESPRCPRLRRVALYFDDVSAHFNHRFAGELLAIEELNARDGLVKIDRWRGLEHQLVFASESWVSKMYMAHDLEAISGVLLTRENVQLAMER